MSDLESRIRNHDDMVREFAGITPVFGELAEIYRAGCADSDTGKRYILHDVLSFKDDGQCRRAYDALVEHGERTTGHALFAFSVHNGHIHVVHDCNYATRSCRCTWRYHPDIGRYLTRRRRRSKPWSVFTTEDWIHLMFYVLFDQGKDWAKIWLRSPHRGLPVYFEDLRRENLPRESREVLDWEIEGSGLHVQEGFEYRCPIESANPGGKATSNTKRSRVDKIFKEIRALYAANLVVPIENIVDTQAFMDNSIFWEPNNKKIVEDAIYRLKNEFNQYSLADIRSYLENKVVDPLFTCGWLQTDKYYHSMETSVHFLKTLLIHQFENDPVKIKEFLTDVVTIYNRNGVYTWDGVNKIQLNPKMNCMIIHGPPNAGKNYFMDTLFSVAINTGYIGRVNNKTNTFSLSNAYNCRVVCANELSMEEGAIEDFKKLCDGSGLNIKIKYKQDKTIYKVPVFVLTNVVLPMMHDPAFVGTRCKVYHWTPCQALAESNKKPWPLALFQILDYYNVHADA